MEQIKKAWNKIKRVNGIGSLLPLALLLVFFAVTTSTFWSTNNLMQILRQSAVYVIMGIGMTFVVLTGGIDLSQGSLLALCCVTSGLTLNATGNIPLCIIVALATGLLVGLINGLIVAYVKIPAFIMTLGSMYIVRAITLWITNSEQISVKNASFSFIGQGFIAGIPVPVYVFIIIAVAAYVFLAHTATGRYIFAVGSNAETARLSGVNVERTTIQVFVLSGIAIALASIVYLARLTAAQPTAGQSYEMEAVAATVIGGTSIAGGEGGIFGTVIGAVIVWSGTARRRQLFYHTSRWRHYHRSCFFRCNPYSNCSKQITYTKMEGIRDEKIFSSNVIYHYIVLCHGCMRQPIHHSGYRRYCSEQQLVHFHQCKGYDCCCY